MKDIIDFYDKDSETYDKERYSCECRRMYSNMEKKMIFDALKNCKYVLDAGCGTGRFTIYLAKRGIKVVAIDTSENMLRIVKQKAKMLGVSKLIKFKKGDIRKLPFKNSTFDGVCSVHVLMHFSSITKIISEFSRVTKSDGIIIFDNIDYSNYEMFKNFLKTINKKIPGFENYGRKMKDVEKTLLKNNFIIKNKKNYIKFPGFFIHFFLCRLRFKFLRELVEKYEKLNFGAVTMVTGKKFNKMKK